MSASAASPRDLRLAHRVYGSALRLAVASTPASLRDEMLETFLEACRDARRRAGVAGVCMRTIAEIWDLVRTRIGRRAARVSEPAPPPPGGRRRSGGLLTDVRHALRALRARRAEALVAAGLLALGLVTTGSIFAIADALLLHPLPFPQADRLVQLWSKAGQNTINSMPRDLAVRWMDRTDLFAGGGGYATGSALVTGQGDPQLVPAAFVSPGLFETLGVRPMLGRTFAPEEGRAGTDRVAIIGAEIWASRFGRAPDVVGRHVSINAADYTVVGVMDASFRFPYSVQRIWLPFDLRNPPPGRVNGYVTPVARLRPGLTRDALTAAVEAAGDGMARLATRPWKYGATTRFMDQVFMSPEARRSIWILFGATVLLMLVVCANVANLGLSQAFSRARDAAVRSALGASRWRLVRQSIVEQLLVGVAALAAAVPLTMAAIRVTTSLLPVSYTFSSLNVVDTDGRLMLTMAALALVAPLVAGLVPALAGSRAALVGALKSEGRSVAGSRASRRFRQGLVVVEVAASVVLLVSAALLSQSFLRMQESDRGFAPRNLISVNLGFPTASFGDPVSHDLYVDDALARVRAIHGVDAATTASGVPPDNGGIRFGAIEIDGRPGDTPELVSSMYEVQPDFFDTLGIAITDGRTFAAGESPDHVIISAALAATLWPGERAVGRRFRWQGEPWHDVVGVAATVRETAGAGEQFPQTYWPLPRHTTSEPPARDAIAEWRRLAIRVDDPGPAIPAIRAALHEANPAVLVQSIDRVDDLVAKDLARPRFLLALMIVFAGAGLVLAAAGVYSVLSCLVAEQLREYGIRLMLGAPPARIMCAILAGGVGTAAIGLVVGAAAAAALGRTINAVLFEVQPRDPRSYALVVGVLLVTAIAAAWRPAARARSVDPVTLLRSE